MINNKRISEYLDFINEYPHLFDNTEGELPIVLDKEIIIKEQENLYKIADEKNQPRQWFDIGIVSEDAWTVVLRDLVCFPNNKYGGYIRLLNRRSEVEKSGKDVVIFILLDGKILVSRHFRHDDRKWHWECTRGFGESGLTPEENSRKEITEETGLNIESIEQINSPHENIAYFIAKCTGSINCSDTEEAIDSFKLVSTYEFECMIQNSEINDQYTIRAYTLAKLGKYLS